MTIYAETSAVLAWLFGEEQSARVGEVLARAEVVVASELTLLESQRAMVRGIALGESTEAMAAELNTQLEKTAAHWQILFLSPAVIERARRAFPAEPVRTLDALHLASALQAAAAVSGLELLSLDQRVRRSGRELGFRLQP